jgi:hypothetical protein
MLLQVERVVRNAVARNTGILPVFVDRASLPGLREQAGSSLAASGWKPELLATGYTDIRDVRLGSGHRV